METALEIALMTKYKNEMVAWLKLYPEYFNEAVDLAVSEKQPYSKRAAFIIWSSIRQNDTRIKKRMKEIIRSFDSKSSDHKRELLKILLLTELCEEDESYLFDLSVSLWQNIHNDPSVRMTALKMILKISEKHTELFQEVLLLTDEKYIESFSSSARKSIFRLIQNFNQKI